MLLITTKYNEKRSAYLCEEPLWNCSRVIPEGLEGIARFSPDGK